MIPVTSPQSIKSLIYQADHLSVSFKNDWYQENIAALITLLLSPIMPVTIQEKIIGADRENIRFCWQDHYFVLNFDCYSQSCWLEGQGSKSTEYLAHLYAVLGK
ncbi:MAG: DUF3630 family protein [Colwellia sp.]|nr:DUF3630 family protein [Colwellia sp.]